MAINEFKRYEQDNAGDIARARIKGLRTTSQVVAELKNQGFLDKLDSTIRTMRQAGNPQGPMTPRDFLTQVIGKLAIAPQDIKDVGNAVKTVVTKPKEVSSKLDALMANVITHPKAVAGPVLDELTNPTTLTAMLAPGAALKAYRELTPLHARTYLHHMAGIPTPFTQVTDKERTYLKLLADTNIEHDMAWMKRIMRHNADRAKELNRIKLMDDNAAIKAGRDFLTPDVEKFKEGEAKYFVNEITDKYITKKEAANLSRKVLEGTLRRDLERRGLWSMAPNDAQRGARNEFILASKGKQPKGYYSTHMDNVETPIDAAAALGKTYIVPQKVGDKITAKAIEDVYKFYPDVYGFKSTNKEYFTKIVRDILDIKLKNKNLPSYIQTVKNVLAGRETSFQIPRRLAFGRPPTIVRIPLDKRGDLNAYDKLAALLTAEAASKSKGQ